MINVRLYEKGDWEKLEDSIEPFMIDFADFDSIVKQGIAVTAEDDNKVMAVGGVTFFEEEGIVWVKLSKGCLKRPFLWARAIRDTFRIMVDSSHLPVSTYILDGFCKGEKLARLINMVRTNETETYNGNIYNKYTVIV